MTIVQLSFRCRTKAFYKRLKVLYFYDVGWNANKLNWHSVVDQKTHLIFVLSLRFNMSFDGSVSILKKSLHDSTNYKLILCHVHTNYEAKVQRLIGQFRMVGGRVHEQLLSLPDYLFHVVFGENCPTKWSEGWRNSGSASGDCWFLIVTQGWKPVISCLLFLSQDSPNSTALWMH